MNYNNDNLQFLLDDYPKTGEISYNQYDNVDVVLSQKCAASKKIFTPTYFEEQNQNCGPIYLTKNRFLSAQFY